ncbi:MAG: hypothetical protein JWO56_2537 [Acidobacteria bacterium]|nr:hypothetical protein [Acidobacteriota bacterium]
MACERLECLHPAIYHQACVYCGRNDTTWPRLLQHPDDRVANWPACVTCGQPAKDCLTKVIHRSHSYSSAAMVDERKQVFSGIVCLRGVRGRQIARCFYWRIFELAIHARYYVKIGEPAAASVWARAAARVAFKMFPALRHLQSSKGAGS